MADTFASASGERIAPDGTVSYDFDGHVHARGLDLDASQTITVPDDRKVRWLDSAGRVIAELGASIALAANALRLRTLTDLGLPCRASLEAATNTGRQATIQCNAGTPGSLPGPATIDSVTAQAGAQSRVLIRHDGAASFLQLATLAGLTVRASSDVVTFSGDDVGTATIAHGLPNTPICHLISQHDQGGFPLYLWQVISDRDYLYVSATAGDGVPISGQHGFSWLAISPA